MKVPNRLYIVHRLNDYLSIGNQFLTKTFTEPEFSFKSI